MQKGKHTGCFHATGSAAPAQPGTAMGGGQGAAGRLLVLPGIWGSNESKSCQSPGRGEQNGPPLVISHSFPTGADKHGVC